MHGDTHLDQESRRATKKGGEQAHGTRQTSQWTKNLLHTDEMENFMAHDTTRGNRPEPGARSAEREFCLMRYLLMGLSLGRQKLLGLRAGSVDTEKRILTVPSRKTLTSRKVPVSPILAEMLAAYLKGQTPGRLAPRDWFDRLRKRLSWSE